MYSLFYRFIVTMSQIRLTSLAILSIERDIINSAKLDKIINDFAVMKSIKFIKQSSNIQ